MIKAEKIRKRFGVKEALGGISCCIPDGSIYGLVGSNGAGKSTLLRVLSGVYRPDEGNVLVDEGEVWENAEAKGQIAFVADEVYFPAGATAERMAQLTASMDPAFDMARLNYLMGLFQLDPKAQLGSFSKGSGAGTFCGRDPGPADDGGDYFPLPAGTGRYLRHAGADA